VLGVEKQQLEWTFQNIPYRFAEHATGFHGYMAHLRLTEPGQLVPASPHRAEPFLLFADVAPFQPPPHASRDRFLVYLDTTTAPIHYIHGVLHFPVGTRCGARNSKSLARALLAEATIRSAGRRPG
jgi:hypothetical protein